GDRRRGEHSRARRDLARWRVSGLLERDREPQLLVLAVGLRRLPRRLPSAADGERERRRAARGQRDGAAAGGNRGSAPGFDADIGLAGQRPQHEGGEALRPVEGYLRAVSAVEHGALTAVVEQVQVELGAAERDARALDVLLRDVVERLGGFGLDESAVFLVE